jgi:hypothetical protein
MLLTHGQVVYEVLDALCNGLRAGAGRSTVVNSIIRQRNNKNKKILYSLVQLFDRFSGT